MKTDLTKYTLAAIALLALSVNSQAQTLIFDGSQLDLGAGWRDATVAKTFAVSNNIYGNDGYSFVGAIGSSLPTYVSGVTTPTQTFPGNAGYESIDNPTPTAPFFSGTVTSGTAFVNGSAAGETDTLFTFTLQGTVPQDIRVGVMFDNTDNSNGLAGNEFDLVETTGGSASSGVVPVTTGNGIADFYFFDIQGGTAGETFSLEDTNTTSGNLNLQAGGLTFDTVSSAPEPSTYMMLGGGLFFLIALRRRMVGKKH